MNLFGNKKKAAPASATAAASPIETIKKLRENLATLEKREDHIYKKIEGALHEAKLKSSKKDRNGALFALKRKKMYEAEVSKLQGARITLDAQILGLESAAVNIETFKAMKAGAGAMKNIRGNIDADAVDEMMDDIEEEKDIHDSISEAISRPGQDLFNDEELLDELAELDALDAEEKLISGPSPAEASATASTSTVFNLPSVPTSSIAPSMPAAAVVAEESEEEKALRELQASMLS